MGKQPKDTKVTVQPSQKERRQTLEHLNVPSDGKDTTTERPLEQPSDAVDASILGGGLPLPVVGGKGDQEKHEIQERGEDSQRPDVLPK